LSELQEKEAAIQHMYAALQEKEAAIQEKEAAIQQMHGRAKTTRTAGTHRYATGPQTIAKSVAADFWIVVK
jgi:hypothetical protein